MAFLTILWRFRWAFAALGLFLAAWGWHVKERNAYAAVRVKEAVAKVQAAWAAENAQEDEEARKSIAEWETKVAERDASVAALRDEINAKAAKHADELRKARERASRTSREVAHDIALNPMDAGCSLSPDALRLRNDQICEANRSAGYACGAGGETAGSGLPFGVQDSAPGIAFGAEWAPGRYTGG